MGIPGVWECLRATWVVLQEMSPYLLVGFALAGALSVVMSADFVRRHLGAPGLRQVVKASLMGVPLPLCSCGVLPVAASLRKHGASRGATLAFLLSTPQTGVDNVLATQALLGPVFAVFTVLVTFFSGILGGALLEWVSPPTADEATPQPVGKPAPAPPRRTWAEGMRFGLLTLPRDIGRSLLVGILISGVLAAVIPANFFADKLGPGILSMLVMLLVGIPMYVCSTGSIPIAYAFIHMGLSPGAAFVFLVSGPATNAAALTTVASLLGRRGVVVYLLTIVVSALGGGMLLDQFTSPQAFLEHAHVHEASMGGWRAVTAIVLLALLAPALRKRAK